jgi:hypothetical protein
MALRRIAGFFIPVLRKPLRCVRRGFYLRRRTYRLLVYEDKA